MDTPLALGSASTSGDGRTELRTFLIADVRGYTRFTQEQGAEAAARLVARFAAIMRDGVRARGGKVIELRGDEALAVFTSARQALRVAVDLQARFAIATAEDPSLPLPVGIGLDTGEAAPLEGGYRGEALNVAARLCNLAGPGEVLASEGVVYLGRRVQGLRYIVRGQVPLKGIADGVRVIKVARAAEGSLDDAREPATEMALPIGGFLGALPSGVLVEREDEWARIMAVLEAVMQGTGRLVLLSGEPGIGKTRLAQEVTLKARHWGFLVATGRCYEPEQTVPFYPFLEVLAGIYAAATAYVREEVARRWPYLALLLPEGEAQRAPGTAERGSDAGRPPSGALPQEDQQRLFRAVTGFLELVSESMPVAILIDDLHWVDDASLKLLQHLTRYTRGHRVLILGTYRDVDVHRQHPLETALLDLTREHLVDEVEVRRLPPEGTAALMTEFMGEEEDLSELVALVHRRTDGNAFFIQEVMHALIDRGDVYRQDGQWKLRAVSEMEVPKSVRSVIGQRLDHLDERPQEILREASVLGQEFAFDDLLGLARMPGTEPPGSGSQGTPAWTEDEVEGALLQAATAGLVRETTPDRYAFNHALTQQALYAELSTRRRKRLHLAAARALVRAPAGGRRGAREHRAAELAWHFLEGDDAAGALPFALLAGDQAEEVFANGDAESHYRTALELARELHDGPHELEALEKLAGVLTIVGRYDHALELLESAAGLYRSMGDLEGEACIAAQMGQVHHLRGTREEGIARLRPLVDALKDAEPSLGHAALWAALARLYVESGRERAGLEAAERAVDLGRGLAQARTTSADQSPVTRLLLGAEVTRIVALWDLGQEEDTLRVVEELIPRAEAEGDLNNLARALGNAAWYYGRRGELEKDRTYHERMLEVAERRGDRGQIMLALLALSQNAFLLGDWPASRTYLNRAERSMRSLSAPSLSLWPRMAGGWLALRLGDMEDAARTAREAQLLATDLGEVPYEWLAARLLAEVELLAEAPDSGKRALTILEPLREQPGSTEDSGYLRTRAWALLASGDAAAAGTPAAAAVAEARRVKAQPELVEALATHGMVMTAQDRWDEAEWDFAEALSLARGMQFPFGEARTLLERGRMFMRRGDTDAARVELQAARVIFQHLGAKGEIARVDALSR